ncbi:hypothetical protein EON63_16020 [archaeon]|nr:MAG: hypothetical protein EON63_16020 [archaeon]
MKDTLTRQPHRGRPAYYHTRYEMSAVKSNQFANSVSFTVLKRETLGLKDTRQLLTRYLSSLQAEDTSFLKSGSEDTLGRLEILMENLPQPGVKDTEVVDPSVDPVKDTAAEGLPEREKKREKKRDEKISDKEREKKRKHESAAEGTPVREKKKHKKIRE